MNLKTTDLNLKARFVTITAQQEGQRVDNFLVTLLKNIPKSRIYRALRKGEVRVNKKRIKPEYRLMLDDMVRIPPLKQSEEPREKIIPERFAELLRTIVLYEDTDILILNKPAKLAVHSGSGVDYGIIDIVRAFHPQGETIQLVHRLDRDTSGCLIFSKTRPALLALQQLLIENDISKTYLALTKGNWQHHVTIVDRPLRKNIHESGERMVRVDEEGKNAMTTFSVVRAFPRASLVEVDLQSGRTHQIRVHAQHAGHPLAGDEKYGDVEFNKKMREMGLKRLFLHAYALKFKLSVSQKMIRVMAPLPEELQAIINTLEVYT